MIARSPRKVYAAGFTLIELLITIGLVAILLVFLAVALGRSRQSSAAIRCVQNLRQIGVLLIRNASENSGVLKFQNYHAQNRPTTMRWSDYLVQQGYIELTNSTLWCPEPKATAGGGYVYGGIGNVTPSDPHSTLVQPASHSRAIRLLTIENPASYWLLADSWSSQHANQIYIIGDTASSPWKIQLRHTGRANVLFADGHIKSVDLDFMKSLAVNPLVEAFDAQGKVVK